MRITALLPVGPNEEDITRDTVESLLKQDFEIVAWDNWTEESYSILREYLGKGVKEIFRFPAEVGVAYDFRAHQEVILDYAAREPGWYFRLDNDERRDGSRVGEGYKETLERAEKEGFSLVDHFWLEFRPEKDWEGKSLEKDVITFRPGYGFEVKDLNQGDCFEVATHTPHQSAWKQGKERVVETSWTHNVRFPGAKLFPELCLLKHYGLRTMEQAKRKQNRIRWDFSNPWTVGDRCEMERRQVVQKGTLMPRPESYKAFDEKEVKEWLLSMAKGYAYLSFPREARPKTQRKA